MATLLLTSAASAAGVTGLAGNALTALAGIAGAFVDNALFAPPGRTYSREGPRLKDVHIMSSAEGAPIARLYGRARIGGQLIWATRFREIARTTTTSQPQSGGKGGGGGSATTTTETTYRYTVSFAVAFCEGEAAALGRVWADGKPLDLGGIAHRFYTGAEDQDPDGLIETVEGAGEAPAYRGLAYLLFENLDLAPFGNRIPQISAEIVRPIISGDLEGDLTGAALIPGSGEFVYGTSIHVRSTPGVPAVGENAHNQAGVADFVASLDQLEAIAPNCVNVMVVVAWFGDDLRCGSCAIQPRIEVQDKAVVPVDWRVNGLTRSTALEVSTDAQGRPAYGGTPSDHVVVEAIAELKARGFRVIVYPFVLMDVPPGNGLPDPYGGAEQGAYPWRGRITCNPAPGEPGSVDKTAAAATQVAGFFGTAAPGDFAVDGTRVDWTGAGGEWGYRRMALHYAHLAEAAGGVDGFIIASELAGLTRVRSSASAYPAVGELIDLAGELASVLDPATQLTYAADWSEYHSHRPADGSGDVFFNLDPLWADADIDAVGIDNYLPLSDWRDGTAHADYDPAGPTSIYDLAYLQANIEGGEYFDWYYASPADRADQIRSPISDGAHGKPWVFRNKDLRGWWANPHHDRPGGVEAGAPTAWTAEGKPIWFTEFGCPAVDKGANQPNVFYDPKSAESAFPHFSSGLRDDLVQRRFLAAHLGHWSQAANNPVSAVYAGPMLDPASMFAWAWDARPHPDFPLRSDVWADAANYETGHWLNGRLGQVSLAALVQAICLESGLTAIDTSGLYGVGRTVAGYVVDRTMSGRAMLEPLMEAYQFDAFESAGLLRFVLRGRPPVAQLGLDDLAMGGEGDLGFELTRSQETELPRSVKVTFLDADAEYRTATAEGRKLTGSTINVEDMALPVVLDQAYARGLAEVALQARWAARDRARGTLPPSLIALDPGDTVALDFGGREHVLQFTRLATGRARACELVSRSAGPAADADRLGGRGGVIGTTPVFGPTTLAFLDMPLLPGREDQPQAPRLAAHQLPWPGAVAVNRASPGGGYRLVTTLTEQAVMGELAAPLAPGPLWRWDRANVLDLELYAGALASVDEASVLNGANALAVESAPGSWEILQFASAEPIGPGAWRLTRLLRGQLGSEGEIGDPAPAGARVVVLDPDALAILGLTLDQRLVAADYRYGPAVHDHDHFSYTQESRAFAGVGLRPYAPVRLRAADAGGEVTFSWLRRTRIGGDQWDNSDVPLAEEREAYELDVMDGPAVVRTIATEAPSAVYAAAAQTADFGAPQGQYTIRVHQISAIFGRGQSAEATLDV